MTGRPDCPDCQGAGVVFVCSEWRRSGGECCPDGAVRIGCPGETKKCDECDHKALAEPQPK